MTDLGKHYQDIQQLPIKLTKADEEMISRILQEKREADDAKRGVHPVSRGPLPSTVPAMNAEEIMAEANKHRADLNRHTESEEGLKLGCLGCDDLMAISDFEDHRLRIAIEMALAHREDG